MLAALSDLVAIGALPDGVKPDEAKGIRATRLLDLASGLICSYLKMTEAALVAAATPEQRRGLAAVAAEVAGSRLNVSAAPSSDPLAYAGTPAALMLTRWHIDQISRLNITRRRGAFSIVPGRDPDPSCVTRRYPVGPYPYP